MVPPLLNCLDNVIVIQGRLRASTRWPGTRETEVVTYSVMAAPTDFNPVINEGIYIQRKTGTENHELTYEITREIFECDVDDILVQVEAW